MQRPKALYFLLSVAVTLLLFDRAAAYLHLPSRNASDIAIYTTERCYYCKQLRNYLDSSHIPYTDYDVETSLSGIMGFWALKGRGVPISVIGPDIIYGLDLGKVEESLIGLGYKPGKIDQRRK